MYRTQFEKLPIGDRWSNMLVITGQPGNRKDFVAGWISSNNRDQFVPMRTWVIDPVWGKNSIEHTWNWGNEADPYRVRELAEATQAIIRTICQEQRADTARWAVTKTHITSLLLVNFIPQELSRHFVILDILATDDESLATIVWESFLKNILMHLDSPNPVMVAHGRRNLRLALSPEQHVNDERVMLELVYDNVCQQIKTKNFHVSAAFNSAATCGRVKVVPIEYRDLMTSNGPRLLSERLGINLTGEGWDLSLAMTRSRDSYWCLGRWWYRPSC